MSEYYNINGKKLRVSDHLPNTRLNGSADMYIYTKDACGSPLSIGGQIDHLCDKHNISVRHFEKVMRDFVEADEECRYILEEIKAGKYNDEE